MRHKSIIKGKNCSLKRFTGEDEKLVEMLYSLFNEMSIRDFLNHEYTDNNTKPKIRKFIKAKANHPYEVWYVIKSGRDYIGYICFKWRKHYDESCEISTAIEKNFRGRKLGYESSKILLDYIKGLNKFKYICGYYYKTNKKAEMNLRKLGFKKADRLHRVITKEFYGWKEKDKDELRYHLMVIKKD